jgi:hypothetical protein
VPCGGEARHVCADLGEDDRGGDRPDAGDRIQACRRRGERGQIRLDLGVDGGDVGVDTSIRCSIRVSRKAWWASKWPLNASSSRLILVRIRDRASWANTFGSRSPAINAAIIARPDTPKMSEATTESLMQASSRSFSTRFFSAVRTPTRSMR